MINIKEDEKLSVLNHSCAHLLAQAVKHIYPEAKFWVGPVIEEGFYYDIDLGDITLTEDDLPAIEKEMKKLAKDGKRIVRQELTKKEALEKFKDDPYKIDLIKRMNEEETIISCYTQGDFTDLCRGPHVETVKECKNFKLLKVSGAYWKGDKNNKVLQRIYGICFDTPEKLEEHLKMREEAKERDHRKLGKELNIFMTNDLVGKGLPMYLPNGYIIWEELENYIKGKEKKLGYHHVYANQIHSYRDLPIRIGEIARDCRYEASGALKGIERVRTFCQNDAHLFVTSEQIESEFSLVVNLILDVYQELGIKDYHFELSLRDPEDKEKYYPDDEMWNHAEDTLRKVLSHIGIPYIEKTGEAAFYGPKLDVQVRPAVGNEYTLSTCQLDFCLPMKFNLTYIDKDGSKKTPVVLHRAIFGSLDRFIAYYLEERKGLFPLWLAPVQVNIIPVNNEYHLDYAKNLKEKLEEAGIRVELDDREEKLGYKMRESVMKKKNYAVIIGNKETENKMVSYRKCGSEETITVSIDDFINLLLEEIKMKKN